MHVSRSRLIRMLLSTLLIGLVTARGGAQSFKPSEIPITKSLETPENLSLFLVGTPSIGDPDARVAIVEFGDYQCPYCGRHAREVLPQILKDYVKTGKVLYFFKDTPVESIHPQALKASEAALCAGDQGRYWEMHDRLFSNQEALAVNDLSSRARALDLDIPKFQQCLENGTYTDSLRKRIQEVQKFGVRGTPTFFVVLLKASESEKGVKRLSGAKPYIEFQQALDQMLQEAEVDRQ